MTPERLPIEGAELLVTPEIECARQTGRHIPSVPPAKSLCAVRRASVFAVRNVPGHQVGNP
jgi:hypothetical protein